MEAVNRTIAAAINKHQLDCPMANVGFEHKRLMNTVFNGNDGKHGLDAEFREDQVRRDQRDKDLTVIVKIVAFLVTPSAIMAALLSLLRALHMIN